MFNCLSSSFYVTYCPRKREYRNYKKMRVSRARATRSSRPPPLMNRIYQFGGGRNSFTTKAAREDRNIEENKYKLSKALTFALSLLISGEILTSGPALAIEEDMTRPAILSVNAIDYADALKKRRAPSTGVCVCVVSTLNPTQKVLRDLIYLSTNTHLLCQPKR